MEFRRAVTSRREFGKPFRHLMEESDPDGGIDGERGGVVSETGMPLHQFCSIDICFNANVLQSCSNVPDSEPDVRKCTEQGRMMLMISIEFVVISISFDRNSFNIDLRRVRDHDCAFSALRGFVSSTFGIWAIAPLLIIPDSTHRFNRQLPEQIFRLLDRFPVSVVNGRL
jgi:hypothetical protein